MLESCPETRWRWIYQLMGPKPRSSPLPRCLHRPNDTSPRDLMLSWIQSRLTRIWFFSAFFLSLIAQVDSSVDLGKCKAAYQNQTSQFTYKECLDKCGGGVGVFKWKMFSDAFSTWLLPWIALMFQLPFGATDSRINLHSLLLAIGSPALAGYSLAITRLNSRWLSRQFLYLRFPNKLEVPLALSALQHIPLKIDVSGALLPSLVVLPQNDGYWGYLALAARRTRQWSIPMVMNIFWVLVTLLFTVVGSLVDFQDVITVPGDAGYPIAALWTYLLPLVIGWLHVGSQLKTDQLRDALEDGHNMAYIATATEPVLAAKVPNQAIKCSAELVDHFNADEMKTAPIFNYARVFTWSQHMGYVLNLYRHAAAKAQEKETVRRGGVWSSSANGVMEDRDRVGSAEEVVQYCMERPAAMVAPVGPVFATKVFQRVFLAAILAHVLQWGTTGASILIHIFTPPKGFGCRALTYTIYGAAGTLSFWLLLLSSIFAHKARRQTEGQKRLFAKSFIGSIAILLTWTGKTIAVMNGLGILIACCMQFGGLYSNCFCSSNLFGGDPNGLVKFARPNIKGSEVYGYWIGGITLAFGMSGVYAFAIYLATPMEQGLL